MMIQEVNNRNMYKNNCVHALIFFLGGGGGGGKEVLVWLV